MRNQFVGFVTVVALTGCGGDALEIGGAKGGLVSGLKCEKVIDLDPSLLPAVQQDSVYYDHLGGYTGEVRGEDWHQVRLPLDSNPTFFLPWNLLKAGPGSIRVNILWNPGAAVSATICGDTGWKIRRSGDPVREYCDEADVEWRPEFFDIGATVDLYNPTVRVTKAIAGSYNTDQSAMLTVLQVPNIMDCTLDLN
ncbi:MAG: hypothetical protein KBD73_02545 [Candidatus Magasanikbacteria bacterium]|nr:hypothetical protein [Candidatus Magasanikbacteria bacterium]